MCRKQRVMLIVIITIVLTGCGDQRVLEKLGFTQTTSYDLASNEEQSTSNDDQPKTKLLISNSIPRPNSEDGNKSREFLTATAYTSKEGKIKLSRQTELILVSGQLRNALFGISLAKQGIWEHIDTLVRDTSISPRVKVTVVNGSAHDLLAKDYPQHPRTGQYLERMLEKEAGVQTIPRTTLYQFTKDYLDDGIDPVAPMIKEKGEHVVLDGIALFQEDRYVTKIELDQALIFAFLRGQFKHGEISIDLEHIGVENEQVMFSSLISQRSVKIKPGPDSNHFHADINITITGSVLEYTGKLSLDNNADRDKLEMLIAKYIKKNAEEMVAMMQKNQVDSLGLGKYVRRKLSYEQWRKLDWNDVYQNIEVNCQVKVGIKDFGKFVNIDQ